MGINFSKPNKDINNQNINKTIETDSSQKNPDPGNGKKITVGSVRRSQLVTTYGPGAIVDLPKSSVIIGTTRYWNGTQIYEPSLQRLLNVKYFRQPQVKEDDSYMHKSEIFANIYAVKFPYMYFCSQCGKLKEYWKFKDGKCCGEKIIPSRFIVTCINGHIEDFPYSWWVHDKQYVKDHELSISFNSNTGSLDSIVIKCETCSKLEKRTVSKSMAGCMNKEALLGYSCNSKSPWLTKDEIDRSKKCTALMRCLQRGASNVYFPVTSSALTIPPLSDEIGTEIIKKWDNIEKILSKYNTEETIKNALDDLFGTKYKKEEIDIFYKKILIYQNNKAKKKDYTYETLIHDEYDVLCSDIATDEKDKNFHMESEEVPVPLRQHIEKVVLVKRLREVMALEGFRRITPDEPPERPDPNDLVFKGWDQKKKCIPLSPSVDDWLPAIDLYGEGIFIRLKEETLKIWEQKNAVRYFSMGARLKKFDIGCKNFSARYVLLHTLAHLLIRQLTIDCGYSSAALKERIYSSYHTNDPMCGILIYTSTTDSDGSLGGLVRQGKTKNFEKIFRSMLQEASWCSSDPVCADMKGQGLNSLNYAACHACTLIAETSCVMRNCLLDRCSIIGKYDDRNIGYFTQLINSDWNTEEEPIAVETNPENPEVSVEISTKKAENHNQDEYSLIWNQLSYETDNTHEMKLIMDLIRNASKFEKLEKPYGQCDSTLIFNGDTGETKLTLVWPKSKVIYFTADDENVYSYYKFSDWTCFLGSDEKVTTELILKALKKEE